MSSLIGHAISGTAIYLAQKHYNPTTRWLLPVLVLLAIFPDLDYLVFWFFHINFQPRFSHSLWFCLSTSIIAWLATWRFRIPFIFFALASCSHLILDLLVGVHPLPILWPFSHHEIISPIGILPSAGRLSFSNYYFWRNLFIECGMLIPLFSVLVMIARGDSLQTLPLKAWLLLLLGILSLLWSISLTR